MAEARISNIRNTPQYLRASIRRLSILADKPIRTKDDAFIALIEYEHMLIAEQVVVVKAWIRGGDDE